MILHVLIAEQIFQSEPAMRAALTDTAGEDDFAASIDSRKRSLPPDQLLCDPKKDVRKLRAIH